MKDSINLRKYMISRFLWTLFLVGLTELVITFVIRHTLAPQLENTIIWQDTIATMNLNTILSELFKGIIVLSLQKVGETYEHFSDSFLGSFIERLFGEKAFTGLTKLAEKLSHQETEVLIFRFALIAFIIVLVWLLPYILGAIAYSTIVTRKVNELERDRIAKEREYERQRNLLLSDVAHDIKTPITSVAGFSKALADGTIEEENRQKYLNSVYIKSMQISNLVSLLFEYVKLDSAGYTLNKVEIDICEMLRNCVARMYEDFEQQEMELDIDIPDEPIIMKVDKMQLDRAIGNLLSNTVKHNPKGTKVYVSLKRTEGDNSSAGSRGHKSVQIEIADGGTFIDSEIAKHLFEPFVQGDSSRKSGSGSGLGLSISHKIVTMHGGSLILKQYKDATKYGKVKSFIITLW